jgi:mersacidin/lichenicidin family type 2 lantibiotic
MQDIDKITRAWKDEDYRLSLSLDEQRALPANPSGSVELSEADLKDGGSFPSFFSFVPFFVCC